MRKQYNISVYARQAFGLVLMSILFFACQEEEIIGKTDVKEGVPVKVNLNISVPEMQTILTRGLREEEEFQINDLYLLIFDAKGNRKEGTHYYSSEELTNSNNGSSNSNGTQSNPTVGKLTGVMTTSGLSYIFAAANTNSNQLNGGVNIKQQLDKVENLEDFKKVTATLNSKTSAAQVDRTQAALVMCGAYTSSTPDDTNVEEGQCVIPDKADVLDGKIVLGRLDSHITFNISWGGEQSKVISFELTGWRVCNVPVKSYLLANEKDAVEKENDSDYSNTILENKVTVDETGKSCSFDFYMLENRKKEKEFEGQKLTTYADREAEVKEADGGNSGIYKYVEPHATFVEIKANMVLESNKAGGSGQKIASVTYTIHLGGGFDDPHNFSSKRNKKYTYNVQVNDTENIRVEVQDPKEEVRPGVEGDVVDTEAKVYSLDAHYGCFIIGFSKKEAENLKFVVETPFTSITSDATADKREGEDYKWIRFARCDNASTLAEYPAYGVGLIDLFGLSADILKQETTDEDEKNYYTAFVDEYYYNEPPKGQEWDKPYWKHFVNKENREVIFTLSPAYSADKESSYTDAQYLITQRSIQTYYSSKSFNEGQTALGMEHINETGAPGKSAPTGIAFDPSNGFYNVYKYINKEGKQNYLWETHVDVTQPDAAGYSFTLTKEDNGWSDCLTRNRDENGDGKIDAEELKWYLPARDQLLGMVLGAESLATPLFDADAYPIGSGITSAAAKYHFLLSNDSKLWAQEGTSVSERGDPNGSNYPQQLRCVRNLNLDMNKDNAGDVDAKVGNAFEYNESTRVFRMTQLDEKNIRGKLSSGELGLHDNFSNTNKPYKAFQMAKEFHAAEEGSGKWMKFVDIGNLHRSKCSSYSENADGSDKGKWRTPNQREFMIMYTQNVNFVHYTNKSDKKMYRAYSRTEWKYKRDRHFGYNKDNEGNDLLFLDNASQTYNISLRCVRDVDVDTNGNIIEDN